MTDNWSAKKCIEAKDAIDMEIDGELLPEKKLGLMGSLKDTLINAVGKLNGNTTKTIQPTKL